jgi:hypothetical protein
MGSTDKKVVEVLIRPGAKVLQLDEFMQDSVATSFGWEYKGSRMGAGRTSSYFEIPDNDSIEPKLEIIRRYAFVEDVSVLDGLPKDF